MNLHAIVRRAIQSVNPDIPVIWQQSVGYSASASGAQTPMFNNVFGVAMQVQGLSGFDLQLANFLNLEGILRRVFCYGSLDGAVRAAFKGGDLLVFADRTPIYVRDSNGQLSRDSSANAVASYPMRFWKVVKVLERWPDTAAGSWYASNGWTGAIIQQQTDSTAFVKDDQGNYQTDSYGQLLVSTT